MLKLEKSNGATVIATCYVIHYGDTVSPVIYLNKPDAKNINGETRILKFATVFVAAEFIRERGFTPIVKKAAA